MCQALVHAIVRHCAVDSDWVPVSYACLLSAGISGDYRGYNVAPGQGLRLHHVYYPPNVDDPSSLLHPELLHDEWGKLTSVDSDIPEDDE